MTDKTAAPACRVDPLLYHNCLIYLEKKDSGMYLANNRPREERDSLRRMVPPSNFREEDTRVNRFVLSFVIVFFPILAPAAIVNFSATPSTVNAGDSSTIAWRATDVSSCTASGAGKTRRFPPVYSQSAVFTETTAIKLSCGGQSRTLTVTVVEPGRSPTPDPEPTPEPDPEPEPTPDPEPNPNPTPPTASCGSPYRGIPDPCAHLGFDIYAQYQIDQSINGTHGDADLVCNGTASDPCVIDAGGATFSRVELRGQYAILQGAIVNAPASSGPMLHLSECNNCVVRDSHVIGPKVDRSHSSAVFMGFNTVWLRGSIHGFGDNRANAREQDFHGMKIKARDVWVLDAEIYDVSGDSIQCGDASNGDCQRVYIGGGYMHHNRENASAVSHDLFGWCDQEKGASQLPLSRNSMWPSRSPSAAGRKSR
jgi:hypothetical protein